MVTAYRLTKDDLMGTLAAWNGFLKRKVHVIACGGTAMTLLGVKESTRDVDFMVPVEEEHRYLVSVLGQLGYEPSTGSGWKRLNEAYVFDLFKGNRIHTTELVESPLLSGRHTLVKEFSRLYLGVLNHEDLIVSKLFRSSAVDVEDCLALVKARRREIDLAALKERFVETARYDITEEKMMKHWHFFEKILVKEGFYGQ